MSKTRRTLFPALLLLAGLLLTGGIARAADTARPASTAGLFGINGVGFFHYRDDPDAVQTARKKMRFIQEAGADWDRFDFWWSEMEPQKGVWKWDKADWLVDF